MRSCRLSLLLVAFGAAPAAHGYIEFLPTYVDANGASWSSAMTSLVDHALDEWASAFADDYAIPIQFTFSYDDSSLELGRWDVRAFVLPGMAVTPWHPAVQHTISINAALFSGVNYTWWDETPETAGDQPFASWDALSVVRHEIGHALGFSAFFRENALEVNQRSFFGSRIDANGVFDPGGMAVDMEMESSYAHIAQYGSHAGDLMVPILYTGLRRDISTVDLEILSLAYGYQVAGAASVPEPASTAVLFAAAAAALAGVSRRHRHRGAGERC